MYLDNICGGFVRWRAQDACLCERTQARLDRRLEILPCGPYGSRPSSSALSLLSLSLLRVSLS